VDPEVVNIIHVTLKSDRQID